MQGFKIKAFVEPSPDRDLHGDDLVHANALHYRLREIARAHPETWKLGTKTPIADGEKGFRALYLRDVTMSWDAEAASAEVTRAVARTRSDIAASAFPGFAWTAREEDATGRP